MRLEEYRNQIYSCLRCGFCFDHIQGSQEKICPSYGTYGLESYGARGKMAIARALVDGVIAYDEDVAGRVFACTECGACQEQCFKFLDLLDIYGAMKRDLDEAGLTPKGLAEACSAVDGEGNPYDRPRTKRFDWAPGSKRVGRRAEVIYFAGCTPSYVRRGIARAGYTLLEAAGVDFAMLEDESCCGYPQSSTGRTNEARAIAERQIAAVKATGAETVVFTCPGCLGSFREAYPRLLLRSLPFRAVHVSELLVERVASGSLRLRKQARIATYHDPCHLGRGLGIYDAPRSLIDAVPAARRLEMRRVREGSSCCGSGGFARLNYEAMAVESEAGRFAEAADTGADLLLSACPACQIALIDAKRRAKADLEVLDLVEWLTSAV